MSYNLSKALNLEYLAHRYLHYFLYVSFVTLMLYMFKRNYGLYREIVNKVPSGEYFGTFHCIK